MRTRDFLLVLLAAALWGTGGVLGTLLADDGQVPPASVAMWRMLVAGSALSLWLVARGALRLRSLTAPMLRRLLATGALIAAFEVLYFTSIALAGVGLATLVAIGSAPAWVVLWDWVRRGDRPDARRTLALVVALAGLVALLGSSLDAGDGALAGVALSIATGAVFAGVTVVNRVAVPGLGAARLTALAFSAGGLMLVPVAVLLGWGAPAGVVSWGYALALGIGSTALAYLAYLTGLQTVPPFVATVVALVEPLVAAVLGALIFVERIGPGGLLGGAALASAVVLLRPQRDEPATLH
ncbi:DMT family transporter [Demequina muriae]|uniref:EamA family transporter n=1 Tax=Demequina muriae TaxID=3051664 RepID=A0ABT8GHX0_9MICO|nr:EamA family transporter [Demequina sp. EGI L300058]MDN4481028.1 EamA family transporter [Demequina sp. EGI L300058]